MVSDLDKLQLLGTSLKQNQISTQDNVLHDIHFHGLQHMDINHATESS